LSTEGSREQSPLATFLVVMKKSQATNRTHQRSAKGQDQHRPVSQKSPGGSPPWWPWFHAPVVAAAQGFQLPWQEKDESQARLSGRTWCPPEKVGRIVDQTRAASLAVTVGCDPRPTRRRRKTAGHTAAVDIAQVASRQPTKLLRNKDNTRAGISNSEEGRRKAWRDTSHPRAAVPPSGKGHAGRGGCRRDIEGIVVTARPTAQNTNTRATSMPNPLGLRRDAPFVTRVPGTAPSRELGSG